MHSSKAEKNFHIFLHIIKNQLCISLLWIVSPRPAVSTELSVSSRDYRHWWATGSLTHPSPRNLAMLYICFVDSEEPLKCFTVDFDKCYNLIEEDNSCWDDFQSTEIILLSRYYLSLWSEFSFNIQHT